MKRMTAGAQAAGLAVTVAAGLLTVAIAGVPVPAGGALKRPAASG